MNTFYEIKLKLRNLYRDLQKWFTPKYDKTDIVYTRMCRTGMALFQSDIMGKSTKEFNSHCTKCLACNPELQTKLCEMGRHILFMENYIGPRFIKHCRKCVQCNLKYEGK